MNQLPRVAGGLNYFEVVKVGRGGMHELYQYRTHDTHTHTRSLSLSRYRGLKFAVGIVQCYLPAAVAACTLHPKC